MPADFPMSYEEFLDNYEFKVAKKMLLREYPWIKDVVMKNPDELNKYNLIFVDLIIDPYVLQKEKGWRVARYVTLTLKNGNEFWAPYLSTYFWGSEESDEARMIANGINHDLEKIHSSPALPQDLRLPGTRKLQIGSYYTPPDTTIPEDTDTYPS